ncbi:MAG TPA: RNA polymerase-associated protein RapA, partial [Candidatus Kapabacteria bacterium]|nr:RNA polymerase-associated protein RapA [Candidatus Kapabacteria bacterium]
RFNDIALIAEHLIDHDTLAAEHLEQLKVLLSDANSHRLITLLQADTGDKAGEALAARTLATRLLDQHGTGRALFRNTRASISGFPQRKLTRVRLPNPACYADVKINVLEDALYPEIDTPEGQWLAQDPRVNWLLETLKKRRSEKFLIICHHKDTACALQAHLHFKGGIQCSAFHEDLTLIERDRSAAWFASHEDAAQALICSEIGSEGRNFQFCHNLVMFDLPASIDQLEQRIGRLDRIGQKQDINIYTPYLGDTWQQHLLEWYDEGFGAFDKTESSHSVVFESLRGQFLVALQQDEHALDKLVKTTRARIGDLHQRFIHGRNRLLEIHSKGDGSVQELLDSVAEADNDPNLKEYMELVFSAYGVEEEDLSDTVILLRPGSSLEHNSFPSLPEDGVSATYQRAVALGREDIEFLSWDHPMVRNAMDMVLTSGKGSSVLSLLKNKQVKEGTVLLEALYIVECPAPAELQIQQVLPPTPVRLLLDPKGRDLSAAVDTATLDKQLKRIKNDLAAPMLKEIQEPVNEMLAKCEALMDTRVQQVREQALAAFDAYWENEARRLQALAQNMAQPADIAPQLAAVAQKREQGRKVLNSQCTSRLDALRIMISVG